LQLLLVVGGCTYILVNRQSEGARL